MPFTLDDVVPWGRSFDEYVEMFALTPGDLDGRILGCGDGPASFHTTLNQRGGRILSVDPLYEFGTEDLRARIDATYDTVLREARRNTEQFNWEEIQTVSELGRRRMAAMREFLADLPAGRTEGRYVAGKLPDLPLPDDSFDLALCGHFLFLYTDRLDHSFHMASVVELVRLAPEVRIFPLLDLDGGPSRHVAPTLEDLRRSGYPVEVRTVPYHFRKGGNEMLVIRRPTRQEGC